MFPIPAEGLCLVMGKHTHPRDFCMAPEDAAGSKCCLCYHRLKIFGQLLGKLAGPSRIRW